MLIETITAAAGPLLLPLLARTGDRAGLPDTAPATFLTAS
jgi:hypothetical protein